MTEVRRLEGTALGDWDEAAVDVEGGHVLQSRAWAAHRQTTGWEPRFHVAGDARALVLVRGWPGIGGGSAYVPRGPVLAGAPWTGDGSGVRVGEALRALAVHLSDGGLDVLAADPEVAADDEAYRRALDAVGFHGIPEIQPSRHRMAIALPPGTDEAAVMDGIAKATRQRIRRAERDGVVVLRWDSGGNAPDAPGFHRTAEAPDDALRRFYGLLRATGERRGFGFAGPEEFVAWWIRAHGAGHLVYLEAREGAADGDVLGGLVLYRHGRRLSTAHSGDRAERRRDHPGAMHLLRWRAIQLALAEGRSEMDLGGVDVAGARREPVEGEPTYGLYEHKKSFGARWVALAGAQERVARPWRYVLGRGLGRVGRALGPARTAR
ncbi:MAG TPA: GNAT family N-acetyltransferase [Candidatus Limnocylindrales bacterium]|nr:GNAT family N-acetyltransferase [Candidatus Limnocylindrales bacterium]